MKYVLLPPIKYLRECVWHDATTGLIFWKKRPLRHFVSPRGWNRWNAVHAGAEAFSAISDKGYKYGALDKRRYYAHRVAWKLCKGKDPKGMLDHRDRNKQNNRCCNLREATNGQNRVNNTTSVGVYFRQGKWNARVNNGKGVTWLGTFPTFIQAKKARRAAMYATYGEFAP